MFTADARRAMVTAEQGPKDEVGVVVSMAVAGVKSSPDGDDGAPVQPPSWFYPRGGELGADAVSHLIALVRTALAEG
jgi:hypothetical protein